VQVVDLYLCSEKRCMQQTVRDKEDGKAAAEVVGDTSCPTE
jgi:hypothetical protein